MGDALPRSAPATRSWLTTNPGLEASLAIHDVPGAGAIDGVLGVLAEQLDLAEVVWDDARVFPRSSDGGGGFTTRSLRGRVGDLHMHVAAFAYDAPSHLRGRP